MKSTRDHREEKEMSRLIDADALLKKFPDKTVRKNGAESFYAMGSGDIRNIIQSMPSIDAVPVIRCKDCKHKYEREDGGYNPHDIACYYWESDGLEESDYCSYGERKEE